MHMIKAENPNWQHIWTNHFIKTCMCNYLNTLTTLKIEWKLKTIMGYYLVFHCFHNKLLLTSYLKATNIISQLMLVRTWGYSTGFSALDFTGQNQAVGRLGFYGGYGKHLPPSSFRLLAEVSYLWLSNSSFLSLMSVHQFWIFLTSLLSPLPTSQSQIFAFCY